MVSLDRCNKSCNICATNKTDANSNIFNMITRINESKI